MRLVAAIIGSIHQGCTIVFTQLYLLVYSVFIHRLDVTYKCVRSILGKNLEAIGHHFHGINCLDLGKVKTWKDLDVLKGPSSVNKLSSLINLDYNIDRTLRAL